MKFLKKYNRIRLACFFIIIVILLFFCYGAAFSKDDGVVLNSSFENFLANAYDVFLFPTYFLFGNYMNDILFLIGLLLNCVFYAFLIETLIILSKTLRQTAQTVNQRHH